MVQLEARFNDIIAEDYEVGESNTLYNTKIIGTIYRSPCYAQLKNSDFKNEKVRVVKSTCYLRNGQDTSNNEDDWAIITKNEFDKGFKIPIKELINIEHDDEDEGNRNIVTMSSEDFKNILAGKKVKIHLVGTPRLVHNEIQMTSGDFHALCNRMKNND